MVPLYAHASGRPVLVIGQMYDKEFIYCRQENDAAEIAQSLVEKGPDGSNDLITEKFVQGKSTNRLCTFHRRAFTIVRWDKSYLHNRTMWNVIEVRDAADETFYAIHWSLVLSAIRRPQ